MADNLVIGHFEFVDDVKSAIIKLRELGLGDCELFSPVPNHDLEDELYKFKPRSPVRRMTLLGGVSGLLGGFLMTIWMSMDWPLRTSAKPIISIPAFFIVSFECMILLGAIFTLLGMLVFSGIPKIFSTPGYRPSFSESTFGLTVRVAKERAEDIRKYFKDCGASEVEVQYVR